MIDINERFQEVSRDEFIYFTKAYHRIKGSDIEISFQGSIMRITDNSIDKQIAFARHYSINTKYINKTKYFILNSVMPSERIH